MVGFSIPAWPAGSVGVEEFIEALPSTAWDTPRDLKLMSSSLTATPEKIVTQIFLLAIRHWAQVATVFR